VHARKLLFEYSRDLTAVWSAGRLENQNEWFAVQKQESNGYDLSPKEAYILSRFDSEHLTLGQLISICGLPEDESLPIIYSLWLGGFITRDFWHSAISDKQISAIRSATLELKRPAIKPLVKPSPKPKIEEVEELTEPEETAPFDLETDLARIESASSYYEVLGVDRSAKVPAIRKAYFRLAKQLHPDRYHSESAELFQRIEKAFTELAQAHETLRNVDSRQGYDIRLRQSESERTSDDATVGEMNRQEEQAAKDFDRGFTLQLTGNLDEAMPYLARAVHYSPDNAKYHAYYGKSLASDHGQRHKAESELSTAVRLEPQNETFRLMLAEFFIRWRLMKRAEGELRRLLDLSPNNQEAHRMLDSLQAK
jgi:tetratricopeptide (TPR) repeat protein